MSANIWGAWSRQIFPSRPSQRKERITNSHIVIVVLLAML